MIVSRSMQNGPAYTPLRRPRPGTPDHCEDRRPAHVCRRHADGRAFRGADFTTYSSAVFNFMPALANEFYAAFADKVMDRLDELLPWEFLAGRHPLRRGRLIATITYVFTLNHVAKELGEDPELGDRQQ